MTPNRPEEVARRDETYGAEINLFAIEQADVVALYQERFNLLLQCDVLRATFIESIRDRLKQEDQRREPLLPIDHFNDLNGVRCDGPSITAKHNHCCHEVARALTQFRRALRSA